MKTKLRLFFIAAFFVASAMQSKAQQITIAATAGIASGNYTNLRLAFNSINNGTHRGDIIISLNANSALSASASLDSSGGATASYTSIRIAPLATKNVVISGSVIGNLINFNGADNVTIDGGTVAGTSLTFTNNSVDSMASVFNFVNSATNNKILNCTINGSGVSLASTPKGIINFTTGDGITGNNNNKFFGCNINGNNSATIGINSKGTSTSFGVQNAFDTIQNCNIYNVFNATAVATPSISINLNGGNTFWVILGNSIYQTSVCTSTIQTTHFGMYIAPSWTIDANIVKQNYVGGSAPKAQGLMSYTSSGTTATGFFGISVFTGGSGTLIDSNIVRNISVNYGATAGTYTNFAISSAINGFDGRSTISNNVIDSITYYNSAGNLAFYPIIASSRVLIANDTTSPIFTITNNKINKIDVGTGGTLATNGGSSYGLRLESSSAASLTTTTSIVNPTFNVVGNTITNIKSVAGGIAGTIRGIGTFNTNGTSSSCPLWPKANIVNNTISGLSTNSTLSSFTTPSAVGINFSSSSNASNVKDTTTIFGNSIYDIANTNFVDSSNSVSGIIATGANVNISNNRVWSLQNSSLGQIKNPLVIGINFRSTFSNSLIANNYIALGTEIGNTNTTIVGLLNNFNATLGGYKVYNNTVLISGTSGASNTKNTACFHRGNEIFTTSIATPIDLKNNLFVNERTTTGSGLNFALATYSTASWTSNYNALLASDVTNLVYYNAVANTFGAYKTASLVDKYSVSLGTTSAASTLSAAMPLVQISSLFSAGATAATTGNLNINSANEAAWIVNGKGIANGIEFDINGNAKSIISGMATTIGANEITTTTTPPSLVETGTFANGNTNYYTSFGRPIAAITWTNVGTITTRDFKWYSGVNPATNLAQKYSNGYWKADVNAGATGYTYDIMLNYDSAFLGTAPNNAATRISKTTGTNGFALLSSSTANNATMIATATGLTAFSSFAITDLAAPLPTKIATFTATLKTKDVVLNWMTSCENNTAGFSIERKTENSNWTDINFISTSGNSTCNKPYTYTDISPVASKYFYRLRQINNNGEITYSPTQVVTIGSLKGYQIFQNYPNPMVGSTKIAYQLVGTANVSIDLFNIAGKKIATIINQQQVGGNYSVDLNAATLSLSKGNYIYKVVMVDKNNTIVLNESKNLIVQ
jgi:hypothetical protein